jgi:hypothetical protein
MYCIRTSEGHKFEKPKVSRQPMDNKRLEWFLLFLPVNWMKTVLLTEVNRNIVGGKEVEWPEFLRFIGLLFLMATVQVGCDRRSWFEDTEPSELLLVNLEVPTAGISLNTARLFVGG